MLLWSLLYFKKEEILQYAALVAIIKERNIALCCFWWSLSKKEILHYAAMVAFIKQKTNNQMHMLILETGDCSKKTMLCMLWI